MVYLQSFKGHRNVVIKTHWVIQFDRDPREIYRTRQNMDIWLQPDRIKINNTQTLYEVIVHRLKYTFLWSLNPKFRCSFLYLNPLWEDEEMFFEWEQFYLSYIWILIFLKSLILNFTLKQILQPLWRVKTMIFIIYRKKCFFLFSVCHKFKL